MNGDGQSALKTLIDMGAKIILCKRDKGAFQGAYTIEQQKQLNEYKEKHNVDKVPYMHWPDVSLEQAQDHLKGKMLIGIVPHSIKCTVVDVDKGHDSDWFTSFLKEHPPAAVIRSKGKNKGVHVYCNDNEARDNGKYNNGHIQGEVRGYKGYVILWNIESVANLDRKGCQFKDIMPALQGAKKDAGLSLEVGNRNQGMFNHMMMWFDNNSAEIADQCNSQADVRRILQQKAGEIWANIKDKQGFGTSEAHAAINSASELCWRKIRDGEVSQGKKWTKEAMESLFHDEIKPRKMQWLFKHWIPKGVATAIGALGGKGKGTTRDHIAACVTNRKPWPDGTITEPQRMIIVSSEDAAQEITMPRCILSGATNNPAILNIWKRPIIDPIGKLEGMSRAGLLKDVGAIFLDVADCAMDQGANPNNSVDVTRQIERFHEIAAENDLAFIYVCHMNKGVRKHLVEFGDINDLFRGSAQFVNCSRMALALFEDVSDRETNSRILLRTKENTGTNILDHAYRLYGEEMRDGESEATVITRIEKIEDNIEQLVMDMLNESRAVAEEKRKANILKKDNKKNRLGQAAKQFLDNHDGWILGEVIHDHLEKTVKEYAKDSAANGIRDLMDLGYIEQKVATDVGLKGRGKNSRAYRRRERKSVTELRHQLGE